jgi:hypothetical protein
VDEHISLQLSCLFESNKSCGCPFARSNGARRESDVTTVVYIVADIILKSDSGRLCSPWNVFFQIHLDNIHEETLSRSSHRPSPFHHALHRSSPALPEFNLAQVHPHRSCFMDQRRQLRTIWLVGIRLFPTAFQSEHFREILQACSQIATRGAGASRDICERCLRLEPHGRVGRRKVTFRFLSCSTRFAKGRRLR